MYISGNRVPQDITEAARWCRLAADQEIAQAQYNLALMYADDTGVPQDNYGEAVRLYQLAADQGDAGAQYKLAHMYADSTGVPKDPTEAVRLLELADDQGFQPGRDILGLLTAG